jgi:hypothetical protein
MDTPQFDHLTRSLARSRRTILSAPLAIAAGWLGLPGVAARTKPKSKPKPNQYGCLNVGDACGRSSQCCSSICAGKKGKKRCRGHGTETCSQKGPGACLADNPDLLHCGSNVNCYCFRTTAGSYFCGDWFGGTMICHDCAKDADCEALGLPGSACVPVARGQCAGASCEDGMACMAPCGYQPPAPENPR